MKIKIEIKHWITGSVLFEYEKENNTLRDTIIEANLRGADLREADLRGANLYGADLRGADLRGVAKEIREILSLPPDATVEDAVDKIKNLIGDNANKVAK